MSKKKITWSTWEELLLACAVKRHGLKDWESVAMELRKRCSVPELLSAQICREKYRDLHRRFMSGEDESAAAEEGGGDVDIPWLEKLRELRVLELKQEVQQYDLSIQSLQMEVKRMKEESKNDVVKPDLKENRSENQSPPEKVTGKSVSGGDSGDNRSFNESNSTENRRRGGEESAEPEPVQIKPDPEPNPVRETVSCNDSSGRLEESNRKEKESSDVQSTASLTNKRRKRGGGGGGGNAAAPEKSPAISAKKAEEFVGLLESIRSRKHGSMFERRLHSQKTARYKGIIRRHVDLRTIQTRIDDGSYSGRPDSFYLDLLLLFTNAIVFFPKSSLECKAAHQLRSIVLKEIKNNRSSTSTKIEPKPEPEKPAPIVVCRKRSAVSANKQTNHEKPPLNPKTKQSEKPVTTGVRSMRRPSKGRPTPACDETNKPKPKPDVKTEEKEDDDDNVISSVEKDNKKRGAADFLKRINKSNSPPPTMTTTKTKDTLVYSSIRRVQQKRREPEEAKEPAESSPTKKSVGRPPAKRGRDAVTPSPEKKSSSKRPQKRSKK